MPLSGGSNKFLRIELLEAIRNGSAHLGTLQPARGVQFVG